ncbi:high mobility group B protein 6-like [Cannabis sativa]|uniref:high mobility group B protein 6-like n=1 Tax=Cannabis sativa TaxID=3483 RepID=UPI0029C9FE21|nr:high mobility group B protein 6-like [Cannabis sativa]
MLAAHYPAIGNHKIRAKSGRKPLQPRNFLQNPATLLDQCSTAKPKPKQQERLHVDASSAAALVVEHSPPPPPPPTKKEAQQMIIAPAKIGSFDASLAEELSAMRKRLERLRLDGERTERILKERDAVLDSEMKDLEKRGEIQKSMENEVDRLYRLKQLHSQSLRFSSIPSLREKERAKISEYKNEDTEESTSSKKEEQQ